MNTAKDFGLTEDKFNKVNNEKINIEQYIENNQYNKSESFGEFIEKSVEHCSEKYPEILKALAKQ